MQNTKIKYLYRDASNYKVRNQCIVSGAITEEQKRHILDALLDGENFIPEQVDLPAERFGSWTDDDTAFFELDECGFTLTDEDPTVELNIDKLVANFLAIKGKWDDRFLP